MVKTDRKRFLNAFGTLCVTFDKAASNILMDIYFNALIQFTIEQVETAISEAIGTLKFFPKPAELIQLCKGPQGSSEDKALSAWSKLMGSLEAGAPPINDPCITKTISTLGGWDHLISLSYAELGWIEKRFIEYYAHFQQNGQLELSEGLNCDLLTIGNATGLELPHA
jgi:hypothetical protein